MADRVQAEEVADWIETDPVCGLSPGVLARRIAGRRSALGGLDSGDAQRFGVAVCEPEPLDYLISILALVLEGYPVWFCSHRWRQQEWSVFSQVACPAAVIGQGPLIRPPLDCIGDPLHATAPFLIPGGGTGGQLRLARHAWASLVAAADGLARVPWLSGGPVHSVIQLPINHVSGWMPVVRAIRTGGRLQLAGSSTAVPEPPPHAAMLPGHWTTSLVPTQVTRLLDRPADETAGLQRFAAIFVGGAHLDPRVGDRARERGWRFSPCYGMTETAAMVTAEDPEAFLAAGRRTSVGRPLPHASLHLDEAGRIFVDPGTPSLFEGYHGEADRPADAPFATGDRGRWLPDGSLTVLGRLDGTLITGGEKVDPLEVARIIRSEIADIRAVEVRGRPDPEWGTVLEAVVVLVAPDRPWRPDVWREALRSRLAPHKIPRTWVKTEDDAPGHRPKAG